MELELNRIEATPLGKNNRSSNVLVKLGFTHEGTLRQRVLFRDSYEDQVYFSLLKNEWTKAARQASKIKPSSLRSAF
jgi:RimJ/RimL family protein N-acetyltransferase